MLILLYAIKYNIDGTPALTGLPFKKERQRSTLVKQSMSLNAQRRLHEGVVLDPALQDEKKLDMW